MSEQHPDPAATTPPSSAPTGYTPPTVAASAAPSGMPSFDPPQTAPVTGYVPPSVAPAAPSPTAPPAYQPPAAAPAPAAYQPPAAAPAPAAPTAYQAPAGYPPPPSYPTVTPAAPGAAQASAPVAGAEPWNAPPTTPVTEWTQPEDDTEEKVGRGMLFAFGGVIAGIALAVFLWQMGFVAALTGAVMAYACVWLYGKGAGRSPRKGAIGLLLLILVGVVVSLVAAIASDAVLIARKVFPNNSARQSEAVISYLMAPEVWTSNGGAVAMYLIFAALGSYSIFIGLAKAKKS